MNLWLHLALFRNLGGSAPAAGPPPSTRGFIRGRRFLPGLGFISAPAGVSVRRRTSRGWTGDLPKTYPPHRRSRVLVGPADPSLTIPAPRSRVARLRQPRIDDLRGSVRRGSLLPPPPLVSVPVVPRSVFVSAALEVPPSWRSGVIPRSRFRRPLPPLPPPPDVELVIVPPRRAGSLTPPPLPASLLSGRAYRRHPLLTLDAGRGGSEFPLGPRDPHLVAGEPCDLPHADPDQPVTTHAKPDSTTTPHGRPDQTSYPHPRPGDVC